MHAQMRAEFELAHAPDLNRYRDALAGIASCSTACGCCRLHVELALRALNKDTPNGTPQKT